MLTFFSDLELTMCLNPSVDIALFYPSEFLLFPAPPRWLKSLQLVQIPASRNLQVMCICRNDPLISKLNQLLDNLHLIFMLKVAIDLNLAVRLCLPLL